MKSALVACSLLAISATALHADPVKDREDVMKERGQIMRTLGPIMQERQPFDAAVVLDELEKLNANAERNDIDTFYAPGTEGGKASPRIWTHMDEFKALDAKFRSDVAAALAAAPQDIASFKTAFGPVAAGCGTCHESFRAN